MGYSSNEDFIVEVIRVIIKLFEKTYRSTRDLVCLDLFHFRIRILFLSFFKKSSACSVLFKFLFHTCPVSLIVFPSSS